jgi:signal transduction histidine kinase
LADKVGADEFSDEDEALAEALALAAGIAIENTRLNERVRMLSLLDDRERIGRDLHDRVVQRLFALGLGLQATKRLRDLELMREQVDRAIDDIDSTILEIRTTIFELGDNSIGGGLRRSVLALASELTPSLGCRPEVSFAGAVDNTVPLKVADHLLAVMRESLTNAAKHANPTRVIVTLSVGEDLVLEVIDDGVGMDFSAIQGIERLGLANLRTRAEKLHGTLTIQAADGGGTKVTWHVPLVE